MLGLVPGVAAGGRAPQRGEHDAPPVAPFQGGLSEARALAADRNVPLLVVVVYEDEDWNYDEDHDQIDLVRAVLGDEALGKVLQRAVVALGCNRVHEMETVEVGEGEAKRTVKRCPAYHTDSCKVHQQLFADGYAAWNDDGALVSPHVVLLLPSGEVAMQRVDGSSPKVKELVTAVERAQKAAGPGLTADEHARVKDLCKRGRDAVAGAHPGLAWHAWDEVLAITQGTRYGEEARQGNEAALAAMEAVRAGAREEVAAGRAVEGYRRLIELQAECDGTPIERELAKEVHALETDKAYREEIAAFKREREAAAMLVEVEDLLRAGEERRATLKLKALLRRYEGTKAATQARERWPELCGDH